MEKKKNKLQKEQDRQCTYKVTWRRVRATVVVVEEQECYIFCVCVYSLNYPTCETLAS